MRVNRLLTLLLVLCILLADSQKVFSLDETSKTQIRISDDSSDNMSLEPKKTENDAEFEVVSENDQIFNQNRSITDAPSTINKKELDEEQGFEGFIRPLPSNYTLSYEIWRRTDLDSGISYINLEFYAGSGSEILAGIVYSGSFSWDWISINELNMEFFPVPEMVMWGYGKNIYHSGDGAK